MPTISPFTLRQTRQAERDLLDLRPWTARAARALRDLRENPFKGHSLTGSLKGARSLEFSLPGGAYRAAYVVLADERTCLVFAVGPHENVYKLAERRFHALQR